MKLSLFWSQTIQLLRVVDTEMKRRLKKKVAQRKARHTVMFIQEVSNRQIRMFADIYQRSYSLIMAAVAAD